MENKKTKNEEMVLKNNDLNSILNEVISLEIRNGNTDSGITVKQFIEQIESIDFTTNKARIQTIAICKNMKDNSLCALAYADVDGFKKKTIMQVVRGISCPIGLQPLSSDKSGVFMNLQSLSYNECDKFNKITTNKKILATFKNNGEINIFDTGSVSYFDRAFITNNQIKNL